MERGKQGGGVTVSTKKDVGVDKIVYGEGLAEGIKVEWEKVMGKENM